MVVPRFIGEVLHNVCKLIVCAVTPPRACAIAFTIKAAAPQAFSDAYSKLDFVQKLVVSQT